VDAGGGVGGCGIVISKAEEAEPSIYDRTINNEVCSNHQNRT